MAAKARTIVMVQHFPATGNYLVHYQGGDTEFYQSLQDIGDGAVNDFIQTCLEDGLYHENTLHLATGKVTGQKTIPVKQIVYCRGFFTQSTKPAKRGRGDINWVLWVPTSNELTVNRGIIGMGRTMRISSLHDAPEDVRDFMSICTNGANVALSHHYSEPDRSSGSVKMRNVSEYFFSTGKIIYGFQHDRVGPVTEKEIEKMGLEWYGE